MKALTRPCWWCSKPLAPNSHATATDHDGNVVQVHHTCAKSIPRALTASPTGVAVGGGSFLHDRGESSD